MTVAAAVVVASSAVPGVPGGSIVALVPALTAAHVPVEGIGLLLAVDAIPDMVRTVANVTGAMALAGSVAVTLNEDRATARIGASGKTTNVTTTGGQGLSVTAASSDGAQQYRVMEVKPFSHQGVTGEVLVSDRSGTLAVVPVAVVTTGNDGVPGHRPWRPGRREADAAPRRAPGRPDPGGARVRPVRRSVPGHGPPRRTVRAPLPPGCGCGR